MNPKLRAYFESYSEFHRHPMNRLTHKIAIPFITFHILAMLDWVKLFEVSMFPGGAITLGILAYLAVVPWYFTLSPKLAAIMAVLAVFCFPIGRMTPVPVVILIAILGWSIQLAGHVVWEKRQPAFLTNLVQALIGPLYFLATLTGDFSAESC